MNNKQAMNLWRRRKSLHQKLDKLRKEKFDAEMKADKLYDVCKDLEEQMWELEDAFVHKDVLIKKDSWMGKEYIPFADDIPRSGRVWKHKNKRTPHGVQK